MVIVVFGPFPRLVELSIQLTHHLTVTRSIIELHGGLIEIFNGPVRGVTVALTLRCAA